MVQKIAEYTVVGDNSWLPFIENVNAHIDRGWVPQGGVSYTSLSTSEGTGYWNQAMVKYEEEK